jgi:hypothetical protein
MVSQQGCGPQAADSKTAASGVLLAAPAGIAAAVTRGVRLTFAVFSVAPISNTRLRRGLARRASNSGRICLDAHCHNAYNDRIE